MSFQIFGSGNAPPIWTSEPEIDFIQGNGIQTYDLNDDISGTVASFSVVSGTLPTGITLDETTGILTYDGTSPAAIASIEFDCGSIPDDTYTSNWIARSQAPGVLLAEDFSTYSDSGELRTASAFVGTTYDRTTLSEDATYTTSGKAAFFERLAADGSGAGGWSAWLSGSTQQGYSRIYVQVVFHCTADDIDWPYKRTGASTPSDSLKYFILDHFNGTAPVQLNEVVLHNTLAAGFITGYRKGPGLGIEDFAESRASTPCPGVPDFAWQPAIDRGTPASPSTCAEYMQRYGPMNYGVSTPSIGSRVSSQGLPDANALIGGERFWGDAKNVIEVFVDYPNQSLQIWSAKYGEQPTLIVDKQGDANWNTTSNHWDHVVLTNYISNCDSLANDPGRLASTKRAYCEVIASTAPINFPGAFSPPGNLG